MRQIMTIGIMLLFAVQLGCMGNKKDNDALKQDVVGKTIQEALDQFKADQNQVSFIDEPPGKPVGVLTNDSKGEVLLYFDTPANSFSVDRDWDLADYLTLTIVDAAYGN